MTGNYVYAYEELHAITPNVVAEPIGETVKKLELETTGNFIAPLGSCSLGYGVHALKEPEKLKPFSETAMIGSEFIKDEGR